jgi:hypothetical protein
MNIKRSLEMILKKKESNHRSEIMKQIDLKRAHIYCKINHLIGPIAGPLLERYIIEKYGMLKNSSSKGIGDCTFFNKNIEIKISLGGEKTHNHFNYVQIRFNHSIDYYLLTAYYLNEVNLKTNGELFMFLVPKDKMKKIILNYGKYAHGTIIKNGMICAKDLEKNGLEYAIRPRYGDMCWRYLLNYRVYELTKL